MTRIIRILLAMTLAVSLAIPSGCAINPVTGHRELALVSESQELNIGRMNYGPSRQIQGGDYTVDKSLTAYVNSVGQKLAAVSDRKLPYEFVVLNNSTPNAWALPGGKLAINRGLLLELENEAELAAVLAHEIVHSAARHGAKGMERGMLLQGALLATGIAFADHDYANQIVGGAQLAATLVNQRYSRDAEREADSYGMEYMSRAGYDPKAAVSLQEKFVRLNEERRQDWLTGLFSSHPPSQERVEANRENARLVSTRGILGKRPYQNAIGGLRKTLGAYKAHDEGMKALQKGELKNARTHAEKALSIEPREPRFYTLVGDIDYKEHQFQKALGNYGKAMVRDDNFFYVYIQRGLTRMKLGDQDGARSDFKRSLDLLPTAIANNALGNIALDQKDRQSAMGYFKAAATSNSEAGRQAQKSWVKLDLAENPQNHIKLTTALNSNGYVIVSVRNHTAISLGAIRLGIRYPDPEGRIQNITRPVSGVVSPGSTVYIPLGIGPFTDPAVLNGIRVTVLKATTIE